MMRFSPTIWASGSRTYYYTYVLIMISGVYLIRQLPEGNKKSVFNVLCGYFIVLALLVAMIYIIYLTIKTDLKAFTRNIRVSTFFII